MATYTTSDQALYGTRSRETRTLCQRCQPTLLLIHHQVKRGELTLELVPRLLSRALRLRQQHHIVRITDQPHMAESDTVAPAPLTIYLVQKDVGHVGEITPPWGEPRSGCVTLPSSMTPAFNQARIKRKT